MKRILVVFLTSLVLFTGCKYNDDNLWDEVKKQAERITALEEWSKTVNDNISALQALMDAQQSGDYITGVTPVKAGEVEVGYTITFSESPAITIHHGKKGEKGDDGKNGADGNDGKNGADGNDGKNGADGDTPDVSVKKDTDDKYYWTVNGEWLLDGSSKIPTTGIAPQIRINATSDEWEISTDGGTTWTSTTVKVTGDAIFARDGIDTTTDPNNVTFTLADGTTKITLPRTTGVTVAFDSYELLEVSGNNNEITLIFPTTLKETDYTAIVATVTNGTDMDIQTRGAATATTWGVEVTKPTFDTAGNIETGSAKVTLTPPTTSGSAYEAMLKVSIVNKEGQEYSVVRPITVKTPDVYVAGYESNGSKTVAILWKNGEPQELTDGKQTAQAQSVYVSDGDVYVAGFKDKVFNSVAMLWKNGEPQELTDGKQNAYAHSVYVSGDDVYVVGEEKSGSYYAGTLWKNGDPQRLTDGSKDTRIESVYVSDGDVYVAGYKYNSSNKFVATLWKNGVAQDLTTGEQDAYAYSVYVSGSNVYVAGYDYNGSKNVATLWKDDVAQPLTDGKAHSVFVSGNDVYVAGFESNGSQTVAMLWKNDEVGKGLNKGSENATAQSVYVFGDNVYVSGRESNGSKDVAMLWKNGIAQKLTDGSQHAVANSVFLVE